VHARAIAAQKRDKLRRLTASLHDPVGKARRSNSRRRHFNVTPRGFPGPSLLAMILFAKLGQHQPVN
jgi:hypothetical protein